MPREAQTRSRRGVQEAENILQPFVTRLTKHLAFSKESTVAPTAMARLEITKGLAIAITLILTDFFSVHRALGLDNSNKSRYNNVIASYRSILFMPDSAA